MRVPVWAGVIGGILAALGILLFVQTKDPLLLIFGLTAGAMVMFGGVVLDIIAAFTLGGTLGGAKLRCRACGELSPETSKFCGACGQAL